LLAAVGVYVAFWRGGGGSTSPLSLTQHAAGTTANPEALVLALSEVPAGFSDSLSQYLPVARLAKPSGVSVAQYQAWGYKSGYEVAYSAESTAAGWGPGPFGISSYALVYRTEAGARTSYLSAYKQCPKSHGASHGTYVSLGGRIGDQSFVCAFSSANLTTPDYDVYWHQGTVEGLIVLAGQSPRAVSAANAVALARKQDAKDEAALRR
jgi:hypothetical protein